MWGVHRRRGACMCSWVTRGDMEKLLELVRGTLRELKGTASVPDAA